MQLRSDAMVGSDVSQEKTPTEKLNSLLSRCPHHLSAVVSITYYPLIRTEYLTCIFLESLPIRTDCFPSIFVDKPTELDRTEMSSLYLS